ncbi:Cof-type HAD-IIB family hydrolase [Aneurinibacillus sp. Ricciae_BoGa-3]|uniref:Cof-type HAD-IIB family hydrolase n=1 Tax=Aneurinibacillus sp. Ricciae_BoGa-3 TaxID=3022697 RepID=UPI0023420892|nr:Cof-type HAD-IIB family hydrolase [Aneurinibacillus sp. Ricciae_BoGa-3]WCK56214.1 Cof-type HAD-IIB family hydrolase [Aneurinibacillus sp. Ricciae_BoGa-3]
MYKMIAIDLDDTLLNDDLMISPGTVKAIQEAVKQGVVVTIATGRMFPAARPFARQLGLNVPLITYQGALIKDMEEKHVMYERLVSPDISRRLIEIAREKNLHIQVYQDDILYTPSENDRIREYVTISKVPYTVEPNLERLADRGFTKVLFFEDPDYLETLQGELTKEFGARAHVTKSKAYFLEIMHPEANKGLALLHLAKQLNISQSEIIGIGDSYNDLDLLNCAGLGIAMGNAVDEVKEKADYVSLTNNNEGVRHVIQKFILQAGSPASK